MFSHEREESVQWRLARATTKSVQTSAIALQRRDAGTSALVVSPGPCIRVSLLSLLPTTTTSVLRLHEL